MELYKDKERFRDAIIATSNALKINEAIIEKDYYVMFLLSKLTEAIPGLLFKGGTCCSHAYHAIDRFSEDVDLSLDESHFTQSKRIGANHAIISVCRELGFRIINEEQVATHSHAKYNCYFVEYPATFASSAIKPYVQIEMVFFQKAYPHESKQVTSLIGERLCSAGNIEIARRYGLLPFTVCTQTLQRTFVDKVFALCDYFERREIDRNSRHIYDLYKIGQIIDLSGIHN